MTASQQMSSAFKHHEPCPQCGSKNNLARYEDGSLTALVVIVNIMRKLKAKPQSLK